MAQADEEQTYARRFLLGYLPEEERQVVEERLLTESGYLDVVLQAESELMEDYLGNQLSADERRRFDEYVLNNDRQIEQLNLTREISAAAKVDAAAHSPPMVKRTVRSQIKTTPGDLLHAKILGISAIPVIIIAVLGIGAIIIFYIQFRQNNQQAALGRELTKLNAQAGLDSNAILRGFIIGPLKAGLSRDEDQYQAFTIPSNEQIVQLRLQIGARQYQSYQAELQTSEGQEIAPISDLKEKRVDGEKLVVIYLPTRILSPGDYQLRLTGVNQNNQMEYIDRYTFRIVGK